MKRFVCILLVVLLTLSLVVSVSLADGSTTFQPLSQDKYSYTVFLSSQSYPEIVLAQTDYEYNGEKTQIRIPCPAGTYVNSFSYYQTDAIDPTTGLQYTYSFEDSYSFETFAITCEEKERLLLQDGSNGVAIALSKDRYDAYAVLSLGSDFSRKNKLYIYIWAPQMKQYSLDEATTRLTAIITNEVVRVQESIRYVNDSTWWSEGLFSSCVIPSEDVDGLYVTLNTNASMRIDGAATAQPTLFPVSYSNSKLVLKACYDYTAERLSGSTVEYKFYISDYGSAVYKYEEGNKDAHTVVLANGVESYVYAPIDNYGLSSVYVSIPIHQVRGRNKTVVYYLTIDMYFPGSYSKNLNEQIVLDYINNTLLPNMVITTNGSLPSYKDYAPYTGASTAETTPEPVQPEETEAVPTEPVPTEQTETAPAQDGWDCPGCGNHNGQDFAFCAKCGTPKPAEASGWDCPNCSNHNEEAFGFCPKCGTPKPAAQWVCSVCGRTFEPDMNFCPYDGTKHQ